MTAETRYRMEKKIRELEDQNRRLSDQLGSYRTACYAIHDSIIELGQKNEKVSMHWILNQFRRLWK